MKKFYTYSKLQGSQTKVLCLVWILMVLHLFETTRFSNGQRATYTDVCVLHLFETTRFSNALLSSVSGILVLHLFETTRFSNCIFTL